MKRALPLSLAALAAVLLFSSCVYDPLYSGSYGSGYYGGNYGYSGGWYNGVYSDFYVGYHNDYYRYRHTRCSHCNYYPCRGGHSARYYTYYRNYRTPLHRRSHGRGHGYHSSHAAHVSPRLRGTAHYPRSYSGNHSSNYGTLRNSSGYRSSVRGGSPGVSSPPANLPRSRGDRGSSGRGSRYSPSPSSLASTPPRTTPRIAPRRTPTVRQPPPSSSSSASSTSKKKSASTSSRNVGRKYGSTPSNRSSGARRNVGRKY